MTHAPTHCIVQLGTQCTLSDLSPMRAASVDMGISGTCIPNAGFPANAHLAIAAVPGKPGSSWCQAGRPHGRPSAIQSSRSGPFRTGPQGGRKSQGWTTPVAAGAPPFPAHSKCAAAMAMAPARNANATRAVVHCERRFGAAAAAAAGWKSCWVLSISTAV